MNLIEKLKQYEKQKEDKTIDREAMIKRWIEVVKELFERIEKHFEKQQENIEKKLINFQYNDITITEQPLGTEQTFEYKTIQMKLIFADKVAVLKPKGRFIIGAQGRIDFYLKHKPNQKYLILLYFDDDNEEKYHWKLVRGYENILVNNLMDYFNYLDIILEEWMKEG